MTENGVLKHSDRLKWDPDRLPRRPALVSLTGALVWAVFVAGFVIGFVFAVLVIAALFGGSVR